MYIHTHVHTCHLLHLSGSYLAMHTAFDTVDYVTKLTAIECHTRIDSQHILFSTILDLSQDMTSSSVHSVSPDDALQCARAKYDG